MRDKDSSSAAITQSWARARVQRCYAGLSCHCLCSLFCVFRPLRLETWASKYSDEMTQCQCTRVKPIAAGASLINWKEPCLEFRSDSDQIQIRFRSDIWREKLWTALLRESDLLDWGGLCTGQLAPGLLPGRLFRWPELHPHAAAGAHRGARPPDDLGPLVPPCGYHPDSQHSQTTKLCSAKLSLGSLYTVCMSLHSGLSDRVTVSLRFAAVDPHLLRRRNSYKHTSPVHWGVAQLNTGQ